MFVCNVSEKLGTLKCSAGLGDEESRFFVALFLESIWRETVRGPCTGQYGSVLQ